MQQKKIIKQIYIFIVKVPTFSLKEMFYFPLYPFECIEIRDWKCKTAPVIKWTGCRLIGLGFNLFPRRGADIVLIFYFALLECDAALFLLRFNPMSYCLGICWDYWKYRPICNVYVTIAHYLFTQSFNMKSFLFTNMYWNRVKWILIGQRGFIIRIYHIFKQK